MVTAEELLGACRPGHPCDQVLAEAVRLGTNTLAEVEGPPNEMAVMYSRRVRHLRDSGDLLTDAESTLTDLDALATSDSPVRVVAQEFGGRVVTALLVGTPLRVAACLAHRRSG